MTRRWHAVPLAACLVSGCHLFEDEPAPAIPKAPDAIAQELNRAREVGVAMERAIAAAKDAESSGSTDCERAFLGLVRAAQVLKEESPQSVSTAPAEAQFMDACNGLPARAQRCLVMSHAVDNVEPCKLVTETLEPAERARIEAAMRSGQTP